MSQLQQRAIHHSSSNIIIKNFSNIGGKIVRENNKENQDFALFLIHINNQISLY